MRFELFLLVLFYFAHSRVYVERDTPLHAPTGWVQVGDAPEDSMVHLTVAVKSRNSQLLRDLLSEVSNPRSPKYAHYLTNNQITEIVAAPAEVLAAIESWFTENNINEFSLSRNRDFISFKTRVKQAEEMLGTKFSHFVHFTGKSTIKSLQPYSVPDYLQQYISFIGGIHRFPNHLHRKSYIPKTASNSPVLSYFVPGDGELQLFLGIRCPDGNFAVPGTLCSDDANPPFTGVRVELDYADQVFVINLLNLDCKSCSNWSGVFAEKCMDTIKIYNQNATALFCFHALENVPNYESITLSLTTLYSSKTSDTYKYPGAIILSPWITPQSLQSYYGINVGYRSLFYANSQAVAEFLEQYYSEEDLQNFFAAMGLKPDTVSVVVGPNNQSLPGGEASLDIQYIMGIASGVRTEFWSTPGTNPFDQEPFLQWLLLLQGTDNPPLVHSVSYADLEFQISANYIDSVEDEFVKAGLRGLTILFASGDDGCGGYLLRDNSTACATSFSPGWPSSSPHVTTVGGTQFLRGYLPFCATKNCGDVGEVVSSTKTGSRITSGGGFSNHFKSPFYQSDIVNYYLQNTRGLPPKSFFNSSGRAYPDISGVAHNYLVQLSGSLIGVDGTSASTPLVAAIVSLLNEIQLRGGQGPLGFLNPWLYQTASTYPHAFRDIVVGENSCSANPSNCCPYSFSAAPGWDPVTGLGTPLFNILAMYLPKK